MKTTLLGLVCLGLLGGSTIAAADTIYDWTWTTTGIGPSAFGTLDVNGAGQAVSGSGTVTGGGLSGAEHFTLLTSGPNPYTIPSGAGFNWDTTVNSSSPYLTSTGGLLFLGPAPENAGFNPYSVTPTGWDAYLAGTGLPGAGGYPGTVYSGTFTLTAVPLPAALPLLLSGVAALGALGRRRKSAKLALA